MRLPRAISCWIGTSIFPKNGPGTRRVARPQGFQTSAPWPPSRSGHGRGWSGRLTRPCRPPGWPGIVCTGIIDRCGSGWQSAPRRMSAPSRGKHRSGVPVASGRSQRSWRWWRRRTGVAGGLGTGPQALAGMTGGGSHGLRRSSHPGVGGSWSVGVSATRPSAPRPSGVPRSRPPWRPECRWSAVVGPSHRALRRPKGRAGWSSLRAGVGQAGIVLAPWRCGRRPSEPSGVPRTCLPPHREKKSRWVGHRAVGSLVRPCAVWSPVECPGDSAALLEARAGYAAARGARARLVGLAPLAPRDRAILAL